MFDKKIICVKSELICEIAHFCPVMVVFGDFLRKRLKIQISSELPNVAHFEVQNVFDWIRTVSHIFEKSPSQVNLSIFLDRIVGFFCQFPAKMLQKT